MNHNPINQIKFLFEQFVELPPEKRENFLDENCKNHPELKEELLSSSFILNE